jgi:hypothetical protein
MEIISNIILRKELITRNSSYNQNVRLITIDDYTNPWIDLNVFIGIVLNTFINKLFDVYLISEFNKLTPRSNPTLDIVVYNTLLPNLKINSRRFIINIFFTV